MSFKKQTLSVLSWNFLAKVLERGSGFIFSIFIARLLEPDDYGIVAIGILVIMVVTIFHELGLSNYVIFKKDIEDIELNTIFWINFCLSGVITVIVFLVAPFLAYFFENSLLVNVIRVLALSIIPSSIGIVPNSLMRKRLQYKLIAKVTVWPAFVSGVITLILAYLGYGLWSLVYQYLIIQILLGFSKLFVCGWKPSFHFKLSRLAPMWSYSKHLFASHILYTTFNQIDKIIVGKVMDITTLGNFQRAKSISNMINQYTSGALTNIIFPLINSIKDNRDKVRTVLEKFILMTGFLMFGICGIIFLVSDELILILFGEKWRAAGQILRLMIIGVPFTPLITEIEGSLKALGNSQFVLKLEFVKKMILLFSMVVGIYLGFEYFFYGLALGGFANFIISMVSIKKYIDMSFMVWKEIGTIIIISLSIVVFIIVMGVEFENILLSALFKTAVYVGFYLIISYTLRIKGVLFLGDFIVKKAP